MAGRHVSNLHIVIWVGIFNEGKGVDMSLHIF